MQSFLAIVIICGLLLGAGAGATYEIHKWIVRVDTGQVIEAPTEVSVPDANTNCAVDMTLLSATFVRIAVVMSPSFDEPVAPVIYPVVGAYLDTSGIVTLLLTNDATWKKIPFDNLVPVNPVTALPFDWNFKSTNAVTREGLPVMALYSTNLVDWNEVSEVIIPTNSLTLIRDMNHPMGDIGFYRTRSQGQNFYQVRLP